MTFAESLASHRARLGLSQPTMAALLDTSARVYWDWETGKTEPSKIAQEGALARLKKAKAKSH
jgi:DNA-binding transcriptional regulator YiaG